MDGDSRQQRRKLLRDRIQAGEKALRVGLPPRPPSPAVLAIATVIKATLEDCNNPRRAGEAAALAHKLAEASLKSFPAGIEIACKRGCSYCCHTYVAVRAPEVFRVAEAVRRSRYPDLAIEAVIERGRPLHGRGVEARIGAKLACPLLVGAECGVYAERPLVCRQATSRALAACLDEFENPKARGDIEISAAHVAHSSNATVLLLAALKSLRLQTDAFELSEALDVALRDADSEAKWLAGVDVFAGCARHVNPDQSLDHLAARIALDLNA